MDGKTYALLAWALVIAAYFVAGPPAALAAFVVCFVALSFVGRSEEPFRGP